MSDDLSDELIDLRGDLDHLRALCAVESLAIGGSRREPPP